LVILLLLVHQLLLQLALVVLAELHLVVEVLVVLELVLMEVILFLVLLLLLVGVGVVLEIVTPEVLVALGEEVQVVLHPLQEQQRSVKEMPEVLDQEQP